MPTLRKYSQICDSVLNDYHNGYDTEGLLQYMSNLEKYLIYVMKYIRFLKNNEKIVPIYYNRIISMCILDIYGFLNTHTSLTEAVIVNYEEAKRLIFNLANSFRLSLTLGSCPGSFMKLYYCISNLYKYY